MWQRLPGPPRFGVPCGWIVPISHERAMLSLSSRATTSGALRPRRVRFSSLLLFGALITVGACDEDTPTDPVRVASIEVTPRLSSARVGATQQLAAVAKDASGNAMSGESITWSSSEPTVATVSPSGLVTYVGSGSTAIIASARGTTGFATIVSDANVATVSITPATFNLQLGLSTTLVATPRDAANVPLFRPVTWTSSAPTVATVSSTGVVTSVTAGTVTITATSEGKSATASITIVPPAPVASVTVTPGTGFLPTTVGVPLTLVLRDAAGAVLNNRVVTWTSSDNAIATVSATGVVTALTSGNVTITATSEGKSGSASFTALPGLRSGTGFTFSNTVDNSAFFAVYVPAGSTALAVTLRNGTGDPDMYAYPPGANSPSCASEAAGPTENCNFTNPAGGVWVIEIYAFTAHTGTTLTATVTPTPP